MRKASDSMKLRVATSAVADAVFSHTHDKEEKFVLDERLLDFADALLDQAKTDGPASEIDPSADKYLEYIRRKRYDTFLPLARLLCSCPPDALGLPGALVRTPSRLTR